MRFFKKIPSFLLVALLIASCSKTPPADSSSSSSIETTQSEENNDVINMTNLTHKNQGDRSNGYLMGDLDGPAYCIYSKIGYAKAAYEVDLSKIEMKTRRTDNGHHINAYMFLGYDVYGEDGGWVNCIDAGLVNAGGGTGWHIFYSLYTTTDESAKRWYESKVILNPKHNYKLVLDASEQDGQATISVYDLTEGGTLADSATFELRYAKKTGENLRMYQNFALDYPPNVKLDTSGKPSEDDWQEITLYNTNRGMFFRNIQIKNAVIYTNGEAQQWTDTHTQERGIWPDQTYTKLDYEITVIKNATYDHDFTINFSLNRQ